MSHIEPSSKQPAKPAGAYPAGSLAEFVSNNGPQLFVEPPNSRMTLEQFKMKLIARDIRDGDHCVIAMMSDGIHVRVKPVKIGGSKNDGDALAKELGYK